MIWVWRFLYRVASAVLRVAGSKIQAWEHDRALAAFPPGCRVKLSGPCACSQRWRGEYGRVLRPSSDDTDYVVDVVGVELTQMICARGMERIPE